LDSVFNEPIATPLTLTFQNCALFCEIQMAEVLAASDRENGKKCFATSNEEQFKKFVYEKDAKNTQKGTLSAVRTFKSYLREKKLQ
jgi:CTP synthase (UTP-ammonia lyase)